jgi:hypothetical protein
MPEDLECAGRLMAVCERKLEEPDGEVVKLRSVMRTPEWTMPHDRV